MSKAEREIAVNVLVEVTAEAAYSNLSLKRALGRSEQLSAVQKAFVTELVNGSLRNLIYLDYCIGRVSSTPIKKMRPFILNTLRISAYQILFLDRTPNSAACNEAVNLVKLRGFGKLAGFVNAVLRAIARGEMALPEDPMQSLSIKYSYPEWLINHFINELGMDVTALMCEYSTSAPDVCAAVNTLRVDTDELCAMLEAEGMSIQRSVYFGDVIHISRSSDLSHSAAFNDGLFQVMDESSVLAVRILSPQPGAKFLDVCAAPGGKSIYAAYLMRDKGNMIACDIHDHKLELITRNTERLGIRSIATELCDATEYVPKFNGSADFVLLDAPCSGLGLLRKKPDIKYTKTPEYISALARLQRDMLENCSRYVKPGGTFVYSTCTIAKAENQDNIRWFSENFPFEPQDISKFLPPGMECSTSKEGYIQIVPGQLPMDGFFIARFKKHTTIMV